MDLIRQLTLAQQRLAQTDVMQRLDRARRTIGSNSMIQQLALAPRSIGRRMLTVLVIALAASIVALLATVLPPFSATVSSIDNAFYDSFYKRRAPESRIDGPVVMVMVDQGSVDRMRESSLKMGWPWARDWWAMAIAYLQQCHAKAIVFDIYFDQPSLYEKTAGDDEIFAQALDECTVPVVIAYAADAETHSNFKLPTTKPITFGAVSVNDPMLRSYRPAINGMPSLGSQAIRKIGRILPDWANEAFLLHYYGPHAVNGKAATFRQVPALDVMLSAQSPETPVAGTEPEVFRDKIVVIGASAQGAYDAKSSPLDALIPGTEMQATAISNMLENRHAQKLSASVTLAIAFIASLIAAGGAIIPKMARWKIVIVPTGILGALLLGYLLFVHGRNIYWLPLGTPLLACALATPAGLGWTYLVEDRQRRVLRRFLAQYVSPSVAQKLDEIGTVSLGGVRRELSLIFTDIAGFTSLSEKLPSDELERFMNFYLSQMSDVVFANNGTLDKYIGDAIMAFWNAPLDQPEHASLVCRTALAMHLREEAIRPQLVKMGAGDIHTRIGVNTGLANVGNYGSLQKLNYTCLGDNVNLASRLEGANKIYGTSILVAQPTVEMVGDEFLFRPLDLLSVKGKKIPMAVYELMTAGTGDERQQQLVREFAAALHDYQQQNWDQAEGRLIALSQAFPDDVPTQVLLERIGDFRVNPPPLGWQGEHIAKSK